MPAQNSMTSPRLRPSTQTKLGASSLRSSQQCLPGTKHAKQPVTDVSEPTMTTVPPPDQIASVELPPAPKASHCGEPGPDQTLLIDGQQFQVTGALGKGSFGVVWGGESSTQGEVAIKSIPCWQRGAVADAEVEGELLRSLGKNASEEVLCRLPALIAQETESLPNSWRVWIVMTRMPGEQLSRFIERQGEDMSKVNVGLRAGVVSACGFARELLVQLAPVFEHVAEVAFHRDTTPRNILVDVEGSVPHFSLIDFGLAVDAATWESGEVSASQSSIAGDGRYWPVSSWYAFEYGRDALSQCVTLNEEYRTRLDIHSLGITVIQVIAALTPCDDQWVDDVVSQKMQQLLWVWMQYWRDATHFWLSIFETFQDQGDFDALKLAYMQAAVHDIIRQDLFALRAAIREARTACDDAAPEEGLQGVASLMDVLLLMISHGEGVDPRVTWRGIRTRLGDQFVGCKPECAMNLDSHLSSASTATAATRPVSPTSSVACA